MGDPITAWAVSDATFNKGRNLGSLDPGATGGDRPPNSDGRYFTETPWDSGVWDENGNPLRMPSQDNPNIFSWQYEANRRAEQRRSGLWNDAQNALTQGTDLLQSYRPGGAAAMASGIFQNRASLYGTQAQTIEAPDVLMDWRRHQQHEANKEAKRASRISMGLSAAQTVAGMAGAAGGAPVPPTAPITAPQPGAMAPGQGQQMLGPGPGQTGMVNPATLGSPPGPGPNMVQAPGGAGTAPAVSGGVGGPTGGGGAGAPAGARQAGPGGPGGGGAGGAAPQGGGGIGAAGDFSPATTAGTAMSSAHPVVGEQVLTEWAKSVERASSTALFSRSARDRAMRALMSGIGTWDQQQAGGR